MKWPLTWPEFLCFGDSFWIIFYWGRYYLHLLYRWNSWVTWASSRRPFIMWWPHLSPRALVTAGLGASPEAVHGEENCTPERMFQAQSWRAPWWRENSEARLRNTPLSGTPGRPGPAEARSEARNYVANPGVTKLSSCSCSGHKSRCWLGKEERGSHLPRPPTWWSGHLSKDLTADLKEGETAVIFWTPTITPTFPCKHSQAFRATLMLNWRPTTRETRSNLRQGPH